MRASYFNEYSVKAKMSREDEIKSSARWTARVMGTIPSDLNLRGWTEEEQQLFIREFHRSPKLTVLAG